VTVRIFDLELVGPVEILRGLSDVRAVCRKFGEQHISVLDADSDPDAWLALFAFAQHDRFAVANTEIIGSASQSNEKPSVWR